MLRAIVTAAVVLVVCHGAACAAEDAYRAKAMAFMLADSGGLITKSDVEVKLVDLNGDGVPEAIVTDNGPTSCGSHGCSISILDLTGPKARSMADLLGARVNILPTKTGGWKDVSLVSVQTTKLVHRGNMYVLAH